MNTDSTKRVFTRIPRWTAPNAAEQGTAVHRSWLTAAGTAALRATADRLAVGLSELLLAAHARVLATVSGEGVLLAGCRGHRPGAGEEPLLLSVAPSTWAELVTAVAGAVQAPGDGDRPETLLDLTGLAPKDGHDAVGGLGADGELPDGTVLSAAWRAEGDRLCLELRYDLAVFDASYAERLAGYHLAAVELLAADPDARHDRQRLLTLAEVDHQLYGLAGPRAELPDATFMDVFQERVRTSPSAVAIRHGERRMTYAELDGQANRIAHTLLDRGLRPEDVVAVVMERTPEWIASAIGVLKAGGVYLPVRPDFPVDRVAAQFERSACAFALTEPGSTDLARAAAAAASKTPTLLPALDIQAGDAPDTPPASAISPGQAAYIYFTSGSTGAPKGALCEHAGMLNHLYMKIEDLGMQEGAGEVVTQIASQCFDISLWQFAAPLMTGGTVQIVDTEVLLDVEAFLDSLTSGQVTVAQIVPSYLEVLLTHLEKHPRELETLRIVSVTGEALPYQLVQRWFAVYPGIKLSNAYGATEVSDDTMHEILDAVPERDFVTVGRSLRNVNTYILNEHLDLVPLGSVGEIAFSGVCVGRGYINDQERTREAFVPDPFRPDTRMYRTGDYGRWLPEGRIEYLGRRDEQVKVRGFRIEIGEIENKLLAMPGVREAAVVIDGAAGEQRALVAFFGGDQEISPDAARDFLAVRLPEYMLPSYFHQLDRLPLTENGKIDKKSLGRLAGTLGHGGAAYLAPVTPAEQRLAMIWSEVLGVPLERIGRADSFFDLGGTSLAAVRLLVRLDRAVSLKALAARPVLADLADLMQQRLSGPGPEKEASELLQPLSHVPHAHHTLVCFPHAGGNAVNFRALASELAKDGIAVIGVEPPGHDFTDTTEPLQDVPSLARMVRDEILARVTTGVSLWGHCAGAAAALETARLLEEKEAAPSRVFLGAALLPDAAALQRESSAVEAADPVGLLEELRAAAAYVELDGFQPERAEVAGRAYQHDILAANAYLAELHQEPAVQQSAVPVTAVVARDDESTGGFLERFSDWEVVSRSVDLQALDHGGHYFISTRPKETAGLVRSSCLPDTHG